MHPSVQNKIDDLSELFDPLDSYQDRLRKLSVIEAQRYGDVGTHAKGVLKEAALIARSIGMKEEQIQDLEFAVRWHDVGKLAIPDEILRKPGRFEDHEYAIMKLHARAGIELVGPDAPEMLKNVILYHHEQYNGFGYERLQGEEIPLEARICQVADVYDALCSRRDYKTDMSAERALTLMTAEGPRGREAHDPFILRRFVSLKLNDPTVQLSDENRKTLTEFAKSDPMNDFGKQNATGPRDLGYLWQNNGWQIERSGHRMLFRLDDETGNKKLVEVRSPAGVLERSFDNPTPDPDQPSPFGFRN